MKVAILVVLYNCSVSKSRTLSRLLACAKNIAMADSKIVVWNNGPNTILGAGEGRLDEFSEYGIYFEIKEDLKNKPLSEVYNEFIENNRADRYLILDQDSDVSLAYLRQVYELDAVDLLIPGIICNNKLESPTINKAPVLEGSIAKVGGLIAVGSGLCISQKLCDAYTTETGEVFDRHYALYGVDSSFFFKLRRLSGVDELKVYRGAEIGHSLSRLEKESSGVTSFRATERAYDLGISLRRYPTLRLALHFVKLSLQALMGSRQRPWSIIVKAMLAGKHPRCQS